MFLFFALNVAVLVCVPILFSIFAEEGNRAAMFSLWLTILVQASAFGWAAYVVSHFVVKYW